MNIQPLTEGNYFHIYNRGVNSEDLFKEEKNYFYFLQQYKKYCGAVFETLAYTMLKNHFHLLVYVKENVTVPAENGGERIRLNASKQLSHFFNSYAQSVNKAYGRTGPLFESPFERKLIGDDDYFTSMVFYCHYNAQLHGMVNDFKDWPHSSYHDVIRSDSSFVSVKYIREWFGGIECFKEQHRSRCDNGGIYMNLYGKRNNVSDQLPVMNTLQNQPPAGLGATAGV